MATIIDVDVYDRGDAVALVGRLEGYAAQLITLDEFPEGRWLVRASTPGVHGEGIAAALDVVEEWHRAHPGPREAVAVCLEGAAPLARVDLRGLPRRPGSIFEGLRTRAWRPAARAPRRSGER